MSQKERLSPRTRAYWCGSFTLALLCGCASSAHSGQTPTASSASAQPAAAGPASGATQVSDASAFPPPPAVSQVPALQPAVIVKLGAAGELCATERPDLTGAYFALSLPAKLPPSGVEERWLLRAWWAQALTRQLNEQGSDSAALRLEMPDSPLCAGALLCGFVEQARAAQLLGALRAALFAPQTGDFYTAKLAATDGWDELGQQMPWIELSALAEAVDSPRAAHLLNQAKLERKALKFTVGDGRLQAVDLAALTQAQQRAVSDAQLHFSAAQLPAIDNSSWLSSPTAQRRTPSQTSHAQLPAVASLTVSDDRVNESLLAITLRNKDDNLSATEQLGWLLRLRQNLSFPEATRVRVVLGDDLAPRPLLLISGAFEVLQEYQTELHEMLTHSLELEEAASAPPPIRLASPVDDPRCTTIPADAAGASPQAPHSEQQPAPGPAGPLPPVLLLLWGSPEQTTAEQAL